MTPKEKALQLVDKFLPNMPRANENEWAKRCALICVDEIISQDPTKEVQDNWGSHTDSNLEYWLEVKEEIEKL